MKWLNSSQHFAFSADQMIFKEKKKLYFQSLNHVNMNLKSRFLIKSRLSQCTQSLYFMRFEPLYLVSPKVLQDAGGFLSSFGKKWSTFEFLFSWQTRTRLLTENQRTLPVQLASIFSLFFSAALKLLLGLSQRLQKREIFKCFRHLAGA